MAKARQETVSCAVGYAVGEFGSDGRSIGRKRIRQLEERLQHCPTAQVSAENVGDRRVRSGKRDNLAGKDWAGRVMARNAPDG